MLGLLAAPAFSGTRSAAKVDSYLITSVQPLQEMSDSLDTCHLLACNIDAAETQTWSCGGGFLPVGPFTGKFNGRGRTITGSYINRAAAADAL